jgi:integrase
MKLTQARIKAAKPHPKQDGSRRHAKYGDGRGLWLMVDPNGNKSWSYIFTINKRTRQMGLGPVTLVEVEEKPERGDPLTVDQARDMLVEFRRLVKRGIDPLAQLQAERAANQGRLPHAERRVPTFGEVAEKVIALRTAKMTNKKAKEQWGSTLATYVYPKLKGVPVDQVTPSDVLGVLEAIWHDIPETAKRVRQRIRNVLDYAGDNDWLPEEALAKIVRAISKLQSPKPEESEGHAAMDADEVPGFMRRLQDKAGMGAKALQFLILTAARSGQVREATWDEIDLEKGLWITPKARMKKRHSDHRVPLSAPALALLRSLPGREATSNLLFPSAKAGKSLSDNTLRKAMQDLGVTDAVPHGFRASFSTWAANRTSYDSQLIEAALHHVDENKVRAAYQRTDFLEKRVPMMEAWGAFVSGSGTGDNVVPMRSAG